MIIAIIWTQFLSELDLQNVTAFTLTEQLKLLETLFVCSQSKFEIIFIRSKIMKNMSDYSILEMLRILVKIGWIWLISLLFIIFIILLRGIESIRSRSKIMKNTSDYSILEMFRISLKSALFNMLFVSFIFLLRGIESITCHLGILFVLNIIFGTFLWSALGRSLSPCYCILIIPMFWTVVAMNCEALWALCDQKQDFKQRSSGWRFLNFIRGGKNPN